MAVRGRKPIKRQAVRNYCRKHWPCSIMQIARVTGTERSHLKRILRLEGYLPSVN